VFQVFMVLLGVLFSGHNETDPDGDWSLEYTVHEDGPTTVYKGVVRLFTTDTTSPCFNYCFDTPEGVLSGPKVSHTPGQPVMPFDTYTRGEKTVDGLWCEQFKDDQQTPRYFEFHVTRTEFDGDDVNKLLSQWGTDGSWDLNSDGVVDGRDLALVLNGWKT